MQASTLRIVSYKVRAVRGSRGSWNWIIQDDWLHIRHHLYMKLLSGHAQTHTHIHTEEHLTHLLSMAHIGNFCALRHTDLRGLSSRDFHLQQRKGQSYAVQWGFRGSDPSLLHKSSQCVWRHLQRPACLPCIQRRGTGFELGCFSMRPGCCAI